MTGLLRRNMVFITLSLMLLVALGFALLCIPKGELHLLLCDRHTPMRDIFYRYYTRGAEWLPYVVCILLIVFARMGDGLFAATGLILSGLTTQLLKHIVNAPRPVTWFAANMPDVQLPLTPGVQMNLWFSFPSGHTTSFFALAFALSVIATGQMEHTRDGIVSGKSGTSGTTARSALLQTALWGLAAWGGYSRIYLSQHFTADVFAGIITGLGVTALAYLLYSRFENRNWYNYRLIKRNTLNTV